MTTRFIHGPAIWDEMTDVCAGRSKVIAAIAFVGAQAPTLLPLQRGDLLIVNASRPALMARATNPEALATYLDRGVRVFSTAKLHAKVIVSRRRAVIGSANASANSNQLFEAGTLTTDPELVRNAREFVLGIDRDVEVDGPFLAQARQIWGQGRAGGPPGSGDRSTDEEPFLQPGTFNLWLNVDPEDDRLSRIDLQAYEQAVGPSRRRFPVTRFTHGFETTDLGDGYARGDVVLHVTGAGEDRTVGPPGVVVTEPIERGDEAGQFQVIRWRSPDVELNLDEVRTALRSQNVTVRFAGPTHRVNDPKAKSALLGLWNLATQGAIRGR